MRMGPTASTPCPDCGAPARILEGLYENVGDSIDLISGPEFTRDMYQRFRQVLLEAQQKDTGTEELAELAGSINPAFGQAIKIAAKRGWSTTLILLVFLSILNSCETKIDIKFDVNQAIRDVLATGIEEPIAPSPSETLEELERTSSETILTSANFGLDQGITETSWRRRQKVSGEQKRRNAATFEETIKAAMILGGVTPLHERFSFPKANPIKGEWYFCSDCTKCGRRVPYFRDASNGNLGNPFKGYGAFVAPCRRCRTEEPAELASLYSASW